MRWFPIESAPKDGTICRIRLRDALGYYEYPSDVFLHDDGKWYRIDPPTQLMGIPTHWMPTDEHDGLGITNTPTPEAPEPLDDNPAPPPAAVEPME